MQYDVAIIGGGLAGLQAGLVLARARRTVVIIDDGRPRNASSEHSHGYLSRDGISPQELLEVGRAEVQAYSGELKEGYVEDIEQKGEKEFELKLADGSKLTAKTVLFTTGLRDELPNIPGVKERFGNDVVHCSYCHGYEVRDTAIAVVGGENRPFTLQQPGLARMLSNDVIFFPNNILLTPEEEERFIAFGVKIMKGEVKQVVLTDDHITGVELGDGKLVPRSVIFVGPRFVYQDELLKKLGCKLGDNGCIITDPTGLTSVPGIWASGNVIDPSAQLSIAAGQAYKAAVTINHYLLAAEIDEAVLNYRASNTYKL